MARTHACTALTLLTVGLATSTTAADAYTCLSNVTCTVELGCTGGDITWESTFRKDGDVWIETFSPPYAEPAIHTEIGNPDDWDGAVYLLRIWQDSERHLAMITTILPDLRMIQSWHSDTAWQAYEEYTLLSQCEVVE